LRGDYWLLEEDLNDREDCKEVEKEIILLLLEILEIRSKEFEEEEGFPLGFEWNLPLTVEDD